MSLLHLLLLSLLLLLLPLLLPFHFSIARIADASHKRRLSTAIASAASASSRELDFLTRATADLESLALGERKPGVGTAAPRMIAECPRAVLPSMSLEHVHGSAQADPYDLEVRHVHERRKSLIGLKPKWLYTGMVVVVS